MKKIALCIHDLRASEGDKILITINQIREFFKTSRLTIHLVMDLNVPDEKAFAALKQEVKEDRLEIVFHGTSHKCSKGTWKFLAWYHKYEAEYVSNSFSEKINRERYEILNKLICIKTAICPSCWIASPKGWRFIESMHPLYYEGLFSLKTEDNQYLSLPVSLATLKKVELYFLKTIASIITVFARIFSISRIRLVVHTVDLTDKNSICFLFKKFSRLVSKGFIPVLQNELLNDNSYL